MPDFMGEPRVKTLLRSMIAALDKDDADTYWVTFGMLLRLHEEMMKSPNYPPATCANNPRRKYGNELND